MRILSIFVVLLLVVAIPLAMAQSGQGFSPYVGPEGEIKVPVNYRTDWVVLGTWAIADQENNGGAAEFHVVYTQPDTLKAYLKSNKFPDGAVLVKELLETDTGPMTTGKVSWGTAIKGWFVMVKDAKGRFKNNPLWGDGWGWALFNADAPTKTVTKDYKADCIPCHVPAQKTDWVYIQGYPLLQ